MRIASVFEWKVNAFYRATTPLEALQRRGHAVAFANSDEDADNGVFRPERLRGAELIHGYRLPPLVQQEAILRQVRRGAPFVWDTDDDLGELPRESPYYAELGGAKARQVFARTVEIAREADIVTTTTEALAERYRAHGIERIEVLDNYLPPHVLGSSRRRHDGIVIGWVAGLEHGSELPRIPIVAALQRLAESRPDVRIASLGLPLDLPRDRYEHIRRCDWPDLQGHLSSWDVGIAPLSDIPFNRTRSPVKLKEYASAGLPWLASPIGPYVGMGEDQGGRLVGDDGWDGALGRLAGSRFDRMRLRRKGRAWARSQSIDRHAERWEEVCVEALERGRSRAQRVGRG